MPLDIQSGRNTRNHAAQGPQEYCRDEYRPHSLSAGECPDWDTEVRAADSPALESDGRAVGPTTTAELLITI